MGFLIDLMEKQLELKNTEGLNANSGKLKTVFY